MRDRVLFLFLFLLLTRLSAFSQEDDRTPSLSIFTGIINYQGDLNPNSFTLGHSNFAAGASIRQPLSRWFTARAGFNIGRLEAADRYNRDYLKPRNLSFFSHIMEAYAALEINILDIRKTRFTPYLYAGIAIFHFNPWAYDNNGRKIFLQPLGTEGQEIAGISTRKFYKLTQFSIPLGAGIKFAINDNMNIGIEFSQRKTFTDYLDDVSSSYVDQNILLEARGPLAVEMAYRGDELPGGAGYPHHGDQRGTPSEMDWYYFAGLNFEIKLNALSAIFSGIGSHNNYQQRCPRPLY